MVAALFTKDNPLSLEESTFPQYLGTTCFPQQYGLQLRFVDIDLETLNYDLSQLPTLSHPILRIMAVNY